MKTSLKKAGLPALVLLPLVLAALAGCYFDLGKPMPEGQETQPAGGVLTVKGVKNGTHHEAAVYDYPDDDVADAADLKDLMSRFELVAVGLGTAGNKTLALGLVTLDGDYFTADGDFLVVLKQVTKDDSAPLRYKAAVPFSGGNATVEYGKMETATRIYTVTFDLNYTDAPSPPKPQEIDAGGNMTPPAAPTRTGGYTFGGWFTDAAGTGAAWDFGTDTVKKDITLYAKWLDNAIIYRTVTFHTNGGTPADFTQEVQGGGKATLPTPPTREGYTFDGWYTSTDYATKWDFDKDTVTTNLDLYAKWTQITYTVTFDLNGATGTAPVHPAVPHGGKITEPPAPTRTGCTFDGWYRNAAGTGAAWDFGTDTVTTDITLYAKWAVWLLSKDTGWTVTNGSAVSIISERPIESE
jgi:uncharacterized repeat protein (TIGR02543 family)